MTDWELILGLVIGFVVTEIVIYYWIIHDLGFRYEVLFQSTSKIQVIL